MEETDEHFQDLIKEIQQRKKDPDLLKRLRHAVSAELNISAEAALVDGDEIEYLEKTEEKAVGPPESKSAIQVDRGIFRSKKFFFLFLIASFAGVFMALCTTGLMNFIWQIPYLWVNCDYKTEFLCAKPYNGKLYWIAIVGGTGAIVGFIRWATDYPVDYPTVMYKFNNFTKVTLNPLYALRPFLSFFPHPYKRKSYMGSRYLHFDSHFARWRIDPCSGIGYSRSVGWPREWFRLLFC